LGVQEAGLGPIAAREARSDVSTLGALGGQEQLLEQNVLDAMRQTNVERQELPFDQYGYLQNILSGVPARASQATYASNPTQSPAAQAISTGIAGLGFLSGIA
jgi:hypothetical protein